MSAQQRRRRTEGAQARATIGLGFYIYLLIYLFIYLFIYLDRWMHVQTARLGLVLVVWLVTRLSISSASTSESDRSSQL